MQFRYFSSSLIVIASLSACGGGGGGGGITNLPINNVDGVVLNASGGSLGIQTDGGLDLTLDTDADFDAGDFAGGSNLDAEGEGQILAVSEGDSTFSAFVLTRDEGASVDAFFGRTVASDAPSSGTATLTGSYVGAFVDETQDPTRSYINGTISLNVDLGEETISGSVTDLTTEVFGTSETTSLDDILLPSLSLSSTGTFSGSETRTIEDTEEEQDTTIATTVDGLIGGATLPDLEAVGTINTVTTAGDVTQTQSGVFSADND